MHRRLALAAGCAVLLVVLIQQTTEAHAVLLRATPSSSESLARAPSDVQLLFSEPIDPVFSNVRVVDSNGTQVDLGDSHVDPNNDRLLAVSLPSNLGNGAYSVQWRSLSTIDVHPDGGQYSLFVGVPVRAELASTTVQSVQNTSTPETTLARWWFYLAASVFGGGLATWKLVIAPLLRPGDAAFAERGARRTRRLALVAGVLLVVGTLYAAVAQAAAAANVPLVQGLGQPLIDLLGRGRFAAIWWPRFGIEVAAVALIGVWGVEGVAAESAIAMVPAILLTTSLTSHGAALPSGASLGILVDWLHVIGAAAWVGGLALLLALAPLLRYSSGNEPLLPRVIRGFSRLGLVALGVVALSGALQAAFEIGSWDELVNNTYGQLVLVKVVLLAVMTILAGVNTLTRAGVPFVRGVRLELAAGVLVLAVAAMLAGVVPARNFIP
ncbi:MAG: copper resistance protein CopC [Chloroflexi bacterium]|nr:copper resistance protein CopC [Chloroflexota bacterium]